VTIGGYATFVSKMHMSKHPDRPDWLAHVDAGAIKVKLSSPLIGISSIHLLTTFVNIEHIEPERVKWLILIHLTFILSTLILALSEFLMAKKYKK
ncbi:MAG: YqhA family protein, partial [Silvanigrellaceae bacterium]|nr:YqhA family protein [Silvanigrellaceae bacterium]